MNAKGLILLFFCMLSVAGTSLHALEHVHETEIATNDNTAQECEFCAHLNLDDALPATNTYISISSYTNVDQPAFAVPSPRTKVLLSCLKRGPPLVL